MLMQTLEQLARSDNVIRTTAEGIYQLIPHNWALAESGALKLYSDSLMAAPDDDETCGIRSPYWTPGPRGYWARNLADRQLVGTASVTRGPMTGSRVLAAFVRTMDKWWVLGDQPIHLQPTCELEHGCDQTAAMQIRELVAMDEARVDAAPMSSSTNAWVYAIEGEAVDAESDAAPTADTLRACVDEAIESNLTDPADDDQLGPVAMGQELDRLEDLKRHLRRGAESLTTPEGMQAV